MNLSLIFITHDLKLVRGFCDRMLVMQQGQVVEEGSVEAVFKAPQHPYTKELLAAILPLPIRRPGGR
jgi:peptide/nickel transport system ATP-binding protein